MKLRNRKTGEIIEFDAILTVKDVAGDSVAHLEYDSLAELNEEWEDAPEEPKVYWFINSVGGVIRPSDTTDWEQQDATHHKEIGNYFKTEEEAEKAVEKLKAWKRLRDRGFRFNGWNGTKMGSNVYYISEIYYEGCTHDMDLLFGGEE